MESSKARVEIGCCGFRSSRQSYYSLLSAVEVQHTFYQPPQISTLEKWRAEAPPDFEFTLKAWQLITHHSSSPTYRRMKRELTPVEKAEAGAFRPTEIVGEAWALTRRCARALGAKTVLFQCPASFRPTHENIENFLKFFKEQERDGLTCCWEPRGAWPPELIKGLCEELDLWHVVDPFSDRSVTPGKSYFRLHGRGGWRYSYEDGEMEELCSMLPEHVPSYVFFNNIDMKRDAIRFKRIVEGEL